MDDLFRGEILTRDGLAIAMAHLDRRKLREFTWSSIANADLPERGGLIGAWSGEVGDPLPELLVVRDEDHADTLAWLSSYFGALAPLTQWCRVITRREAARICHHNRQASLGRRLGMWVGATLAECSFQASGAFNMKEMSGAAALSSATYAAGRATAVWGKDVVYRDLARRHDELSKSLREGTRLVSADRLSTMWYLLSGNMGQSPNGNQRAMQPLSQLLDRALAHESSADTAELVQIVSLECEKNYELPELAECARGPQAERVRAVDRLAEKLAQGPNSPTIEALLGLGASLVDPGSPALYELLRKYASRFPLALIWQGAFAGAWSPVRVLTEQQELGRIISKSLLAPNDFQTRPTCDIAYEELSRWLAPGKSGQKLDLRGMSARSLAVEIMTGVTCVFLYGRVESMTGSQSGYPTRVEPGRNPPEPRTTNRGQRSLADIDDLLSHVVERVSLLEQLTAGFQPTLDLPDPKKSRRSSRPLKKG